MGRIETGFRRVGLVGSVPLAVIGAGALLFGAYCWLRNDYVVWIDGGPGHGGYAFRVKNSDHAKLPQLIAEEAKNRADLQRAMGKLATADMFVDLIPKPWPENLEESMATAFAAFAAAVAWLASCWAVGWTVRGFVGQR